VTVHPLAKSFVGEVEQEVLGALLRGGDLRKVSSFLQSQHFISDIHAVLYTAIVEAFERYGSTSIPIVAKLLPEDSGPGFLSRTGESALSYMSGISETTVFGPAGIERSGRAVVEQWARLKSGELGERLTAAAADPGADAKRIIKGVQGELETIATEMRSGPRRTTKLSIGQASDIAVAEIKRTMENKNGLTGTTWGLTDVNRATGGIQRGEMVVLGARPSMGKTAIAGSVAIRAARTGAGVGFISLEMGASKIAMRALTDIAYDRNIKVAYSNLITGRIGPAELEYIEWAQHELKDLPLIFEEQSGLSLTDLRLKIERIAEDLHLRGRTLDVLIVDYLQLLQPSARYSGNRNSETSEISAALRNFAREFDCGMIALSQLSRQVEARDDKRPQLSDLRDSGSIEQDADAVIFLFREAYYLQKAKGKNPGQEDERINRLVDVQNKLEFIISKQRNGPTKTVDLFIDIASSAVRNAVQA
jgi:replicative DNA helicase